MKKPEAPLRLSPARDDNILPSAFQKGKKRRRGDVLNMDKAPPWLISFTDIMALMLTFFVMMYAMSEPDEKAMSAMMATMRHELHVVEGAPKDSGPNDIVNVQRINFSRALPLDYLESLLHDALQDENGEMWSTPILLDGSLVIPLPQDALFATASADLNETSIRKLYKLSANLSKIRNRIEIIGHSDPSPIRNVNSEYPSNWELSIDRAASIAGILRRGGYTRPITIRGYSSVGYNSLDPSAPQSIREKYARRVDIHIMPDNGVRSLRERLKLE